MQHKGNLTISRYSNDTIAIKVEDDNGCRILVAKLTPHDFAMALTGLSNVDCQYTVTAENAGKIREIKTVIVPVDESHQMIQADEKAAILATYEVDGWKAYPPDLGNHKKKLGNGYEVAFTRFVDADTATSD